MSLMLALLPAAAAASAWTQVVAKAPWAGRSDPQLAVLGGRLILLGGHANNKYYNDVWSSADGGRSWVQLLPAAPWSNRSYHTAKVFEDQLFMLGGHNGATWFNDIWSTADGVTWKLVTAAAAWSPRAAAALQFLPDGTMLVMGGSDGLLKPIGDGKVFNDVWASVDRGATWSLRSAAAPWAAREGLQKLTALYTLDNKSTVVLTAGEAGYFGPYYNDVWSTTDGANWTLLNGGTGFSKRSGNLLLNVGGALFTFGGYGLPFMKHDAYCLPPSTASAEFVKLPSAPWRGRFDYDMAEVNGSIVLLGGEASLFGTGGPYFNDVWVYDAPACAPARK